MKKHGKLFALLNMLTLIGVLVVNYLATSLPLNGKSTGGLSDSYPNLFVPAGLTFAIWGVLYLAQLAFAIYGIVAAFSNQEKPKEALNKIGPFFLIVNILNVAWIFAWHYQIMFLSLIIMLGFLATLIAIYLRLNIGKSDDSLIVKAFIHIPFSLYLGWITVATIANVVTLIVDMGWAASLGNPVVWTVIVVVVAIVLTLINAWTRKDIAYSLVIVWALYGIVHKRGAIDPQTTMPIIVTCWIGIGMIIIGNIMSRLLQRKT